MKQNILKNNRFQALWIGIHGLIFLMMLVFFAAGTRFKINTNLFDILPKSNASREVSKADNVFGNKSGRTFIVLSRANSFGEAKANAESLYKELSKSKNNECFESLSLYMDENVVGEIKDFYYKNRYYLLEEKTAESLYTKAGIDDFLTEVQLNMYGGWVGIENIKEDPFFLGETEMMNATSHLMDSGTSMGLTDGVLNTFYEDQCYVMLRGVLSPKGSSITNKKSGVKKIYECVKKIKKEHPEADFIYSGVPFHSYESSSSAQKEITIISIVSVVLIVLLCFYFFRNLLPVLCSVGAITVSSLFALASVLVVFKEIHILTFVFGTTLIGTCLDYSVHYFTRWKGDFELNSGSEIRKKLIKGLSLSLISTEICYLLLCFAPFALLKQVAVFSFTGILSSYLTAVCIYPLLKAPEKKAEIPLSKKIEKFLSNKKIRKHKLHILYVLILILVVTTLAVKNNIRIENNLKSFYSMKGKLLEDEKTSNLVLNSGSNGWYFIVKGTSKDVLLENEAEFCKSLDDYIKRKNISGMTYNSTSKYIPAKSVQKKSYESIKKLLSEVKNQYLVIGYDLVEAQKLTNDFIAGYNNDAGKFIDIEQNVPHFMKDAVSGLWIGEVDGEWFSVVMPMHFPEIEDCRTLASLDDNVYFMNKVSDIGKELDVLTQLMMIFLSVAFVVMMVVLLFVYGPSKTKRIMVIPLITVLSCICVLTVAGIPLSFFNVTGIILVFGLSIDYIIYAVENSEGLNTVAILLSFVSSALSFGALALSSFAPVFMFGLTVFVGLLTAVIGTVLIRD